MNNNFSAKVYPMDDEIDLSYEINKEDIKKEDIKKFINEIYKNLSTPDGLINLPDTSYDPNIHTKSFVGHVAFGDPISIPQGQGGLHRIYGGARSCGKRLQSLHNNPSFICEVDSVEAEENDNNEHVFDSFRLGSFNSAIFDSFDAIYNAAVIPDRLLMTPQGITISNEEDQKTINKRNKKNMQDFIRNKYDDRRIK